MAVRFLFYVLGRTVYIAFVFAPTILRGQLFLAHAGSP